MSENSGEAVGIIFNPLAGKGRAAMLAEGLKARLETACYRVVLRQSQASYKQGELDSYLQSLSALVVVGGDGTMAPLLCELARIRTPVYMAPAGNESLFARNFSMKREADAVLKAVSRREVSEHYFGYAGKVPFFCTVSIGLDSLTVMCAAKDRSGPIGHIGYVLPAIGAALSFRMPEISLVIDGKSEVFKERGYLNIANCPEYAGQICPVPEAESREPLLAARFYPGHNLLGYLRWCGCFLLKRRVDTTGSKLFTGRVFEITVGQGDSFPVQADGEFIGFTPQTIKASADSIHVLQAAF